MKRFAGFILFLCMFFAASSYAASVPAEDEEIISPSVRVPDYVSWLLETASGEVGYREEDHGRTKYGEWAGDPYCQWCAEFLCYCVDQVDQIHGTSLLNQVFPRYSGSNTGRAWFIKAGRFVVRSGEIEGWGYQWLRGRHEFIRTGDYIPQPGDYVFFTWTSGDDTDHVALVEYCTRDLSGAIRIHVIEGNNPVAVSRNVYSLTDSHILGFGTVHDLADITMRAGNNGEKVRQLQEKLAYLGYLDEIYITGGFGNSTSEAVKSFQSDHAQRPTGIASQDTQLLLDEEVERKADSDPLTWTVIDDEDE